jgi:hypothetical protein
MTIEEAKFYPTADREPVPLEPGELPSSYGKNRLVLLPVDPYLMYTYWELAANAPPTAGTRPILRFHEYTAAAGPGISRPFDVDIDLAAGNCYVHLWSPDKSYHADLGLRSEDGGFVSLARSNTVRTPPASPAAPPQALAVALVSEMPEPVENAIVTPAHSEQELAEMLAKCVTALRLSLPPEFENILTFARLATSYSGALQEILPDTLIQDAPIPGTPIPFDLADLDELDLTQYSEERFTPGISSDGGPLGQ